MTHIPTPDRIIRLEFWIEKYELPVKQAKDIVDNHKPSFAEAMYIFAFRCEEATQALKEAAVWLRKDRK